MSYKLKFTDMANEDLRNIAFDIAFQAKDKEVAKNFIQKLCKECKILETFPDSGALPKDRVLRSAGQRFLVYNGYLIFYTTDEEKEIVYILSVFNEKQDYIRIMKRFM
jgi:plasmid stabilization system protein ParE